MSPENKNYPPDCATPNWPRVIYYEKFSRYCSPVQLAVLAALSPHPEIKEKVHIRAPLTPEEMTILQDLYHDYGALIRMRAEML